MIPASGRVAPPPPPKWVRSIQLHTTPPPPTGAGGTHSHQTGGAGGTIPFRGEGGEGLAGLEHIYIYIYNTNVK